MWEGLCPSHLLTQDGTSEMGIITGPVEAAGLQGLHFSTDKLVREPQALPGTIRALIATLMPENA